MGYREHAPADALRRHVVCYWEQRPDAGDACVRPHRVLPDGCMDILLWIGPSGAAPHVVGTMTSALVAHAEAGATALGVRFHPGEAFAFLDVAADEARDRLLAPAEAGRRDLSELGDRVSSAPPSLEAHARLLDAWLLARLPRARPSDPRVRRAVSLLRASQGTVRVAEVAASVGIGDRQLERVFAERVGIAPKSFARVLRLHALVAQIDAHLATPRADEGRIARALPWARLSADAGYADQAHMARETRILTGVTPTELARERMSDSFKAAAAISGM